jgi:hypothetical protein
VGAVADRCNGVVEGLSKVRLKELSKYYHQGRRKIVHTYIVQRPASLWEMGLGNWALNTHGAIEESAGEQLSSTTRASASMQGSIVAFDPLQVCRATKNLVQSGWSCRLDSRWDDCMIEEVRLR